MDARAVLTPSQLRTLFDDKAPGLLWEGCDWLSRTDSDGNLDLHGFLTSWVAACHFNPHECIEFLVYLGYGGGNLAAADSAIKVRDLKPPT